VEENLWELCSGETIGFVRGRLAQVLFSKDEVKKRLSTLSGGEAARLIFARLAVQEPNVLVLDEPTNHLDLEAIEALVKALRSYDGTLIFVSHDRWFVSQLANRIVEITPSGLQTFDGTYEEYVAKCGDDHLDAESVALRVRREKRRQKSVQRSGDPQHHAKQSKKLASERDRLTQAIEQAESRVHEINEIFCDPTYFGRTPPKEVKKLEQEQTKLKGQIEEQVTKWAEIEEQLAAFD
jgi:ABC-type multidrug transport system ATPase subunit